MKAPDTNRCSYGEAIFSAFDYLLTNYSEVFVIGQGLWSPWYVGNTMTNLDKKFGCDRIIDSPVSESATTGAAIGASLTGMRPIVVHPRMDFMLYAMDSIVNQAAKWSYMFGGQDHPAVTIRGIINRGGEQGAQHSQSLHAWFAHIPGIRVVMPATVSDARDLLIASVLCDDPVLYIDDRWLYDQSAELGPIVELDLSREGPRCLLSGSDVTVVASGYSTSLALQAAAILSNDGIKCDVIDLRVINPFNPLAIVESVKRTRRLVVVDGGWSSCGMASEVIASVCERIPLGCFLNLPIRITLPSAPAPSAKILENSYYPDVSRVVRQVNQMLNY